MVPSRMGIRRVETKRQSVFDLRKRQFLSFARIMGPGRCHDLGTTLRLLCHLGVRGRVRAEAPLMSITEATARTYLGDGVIKDMARRMLFEVAGERPGADLMEAPRTVRLPLALVGMTVAALAEAMQVRAANEPPDHLGDVITTFAQALSGFGQITAGAAPKQAGDPSEILFP